MWRPYYEQCAILGSPRAVRTGQQGTDAGGRDKRPAKFMQNAAAVAGVVVGGGGDSCPISRIQLHVANHKLGAKRDGHRLPGTRNGANFIKTK